MTDSIGRSVGRAAAVLGLVLALVTAPGIALADSGLPTAPAAPHGAAEDPAGPIPSPADDEGHLPEAPFEDGDEGTLPSPATLPSSGDGEDEAGTGGPAAPQSEAGGWVGEGAQRRYIDPATGLPVTSRVLQIDGVVYAFTSDGLIAEGWFTAPDGRIYYSTPQGVRSGWIAIGSAWYYGDPAAMGARVNGWLDDGAARYYMGPTGAMLTGWHYLDSAWYFFDSSGAMRTGWLPQGSTWYRLDPSGAMATGWRAVNGAWYFFHSTGAMATGWVQDRGTWYYLTPSGAMTTGWLPQGSTWYYLKGSGAMAVDWEAIGGGWNLFDHYSGAWITDRASFQKDWDRAKPLYSPTNYLLLVDTSAVHCTGFYWREGAWWPQHDWPCSVGASATPTITGTYSIGSRGRSFGRGYTAYWWTQIWGDYLFHSTLYREGTLTPLDSRLGMHISHGCIRMRYEDAQWINRTIPSGTTVRLY